MSLPCPAHCPHATLPEYCICPKEPPPVKTHAERDAQLIALRLQILLTRDYLEVAYNELRTRFGDDAMKSVIGARETNDKALEIARGEG